MTFLLCALLLLPPNEGTLTVLGQASPTAPDLAALISPNQTSLTATDQAGLTGPNQAASNAPARATLTATDAATQTGADQSPMTAPAQVGPAASDQAGLTGPNQATSNAPVRATLTVTDAATLIASGDQYFIKIDYPQAIEAYEGALAQDPGNAGVLWRLARAYVCMGEVLEVAADRAPLFKRAEDYARRSISLDSMTAEGHTWLAGALGYLALDADIRDQVRLSRELLDETTRALRIDPRADGALSIRGSFYRALGNVGWLKRQLAGVFLGNIPDGGFPEAEAALLQAVTLAPEIMRHHYELGVLYLDWERPEDARRSLKQAASLQIRTAIDRPRKEKALRLLSEIE
jgi:tetratricopeptide (TPR) repeat protein